VFLKKIKEAIRFVEKMFPIRAGSFNNFIALVRDNEGPIEIETTFDPETSLNTFAENPPAVVGLRRGMVRLVSRTVEGQGIVYERFCGFVFELGEVEREKKIYEEMQKQAKAFIERITMKWPEIKIVNMKQFLPERRGDFLSGKKAMAFNNNKQKNPVSMNFQVMVCFGCPR